MNRLHRHNRSMRLCVVLFLLFASMTAHGAWSWASPQPQGNILDGVVWAESPGEFVAVGQAGMVLTSLSGAAGSWQIHNSGTTAWFQDIVWTGSELLAVGTAGTVATSTDGRAWTLQTIAGGASLYAVIQAGPQFVVVGSGGTILTSPDGRQWTQRDSGSTAWLNDVDWSGSAFVAVGSGGTILRSTDALTWTAVPSGSTASLEGVAWNGQLFAVVGEHGAVLTSGDGITWTARDAGTAESLRKLRWIGGRFAAPGFNGVFLTSADGVRWTSEATGSNTLLEDLALAPDGTQVMVGKHGTLLRDIGTGWQSVLAGGGEPLRGVAMSGRDYVAVGDHGTILRAANGGPPRPQASPVNERLNQVIWDGTHYVAVGEAGSVLESADGVAWRVIDTAGIPLRAIAHGPGGYVAVGANGVILAGATPGNMVRQPAGTAGGLNDVTWSGAEFIAAGDNGVLLTSADGTAWTTGTYAVGVNLHGVACGKGHCVAGGDDGTLLRTTDLLHWLPVATPTADAIYRIAWDGRRYLAANASGAVATGVLTSADGTTWRSEPVTGNELYAAGADGQTAVLVGEGGAILTRPDPTADTNPKGPPAPASGSGSSGALDPWSLLLGVALTGRAARRRRG
jgi:photosystem II stability/assembly factor-like uncharacterized protein